MRYLCLIYASESAWQSLSPAEAGAMMAAYQEFTRSIQESGQYVGGNRLQPVHTATSVRIRDGRLSATDGPFAETKEQLGGYYLVEARDLNEAIQIAGRIPAARTGTVEVRPIADSHLNPPPGGN